MWKIDRQARTIVLFQKIPPIVIFNLWKICQLFKVNTLPKIDPDRKMLPIYQLFYKEIRLMNFKGKTKKISRMKLLSTNH